MYTTYVGTAPSFRSMFLVCVCVGVLWSCCWVYTRLMFTWHIHARASRSTASEHDAQIVAITITSADEKTPMICIVRDRYTAERHGRLIAPKNFSNSSCVWKPELLITVQTERILILIESRKTLPIELARRSKTVRRQWSVQLKSHAERFAQRPITANSLCVLSHLQRREQCY